MPNKAAMGQPVAVRAQVTLFDEPYQTLVLQAEGSSVYCRIENHPNHILRPGDWVLVRGTAAKGNFAPTIHVQSLSWLSSGELPVPIKLNHESLMREEMDNVWGLAHLRILQFRKDPRAFEDEPLWVLTLEDDEGMRFPAFWFGDATAAQAWPGSDAEITAVVGTVGNGYGQKIKPSLLMNGASKVHILHSPKLTWDQPRISIDRLMAYGSGTRLGETVRMQGVVTYIAEDESFYLNDGTAGTVIWPGWPASVKVGETVEVTGVISRDGDRFGLASANYRPTAPITLTPIQLPPGDESPNWFGGQLIETSVVFRHLEQHNDMTTIFGDLGSRTVTVEWRNSPAWERAKDFVPGDLITVRGVADFQSSGNDTYDIRLLARFPSDISILKRGSWWRRINWPLVSGIVFILFVLGLVRVALMRRQMQAVMAERARIARELHDTLLQGFSGLILHLEAISNQIVQEPQTSRLQLSEALSRMEGYLEDARGSIAELRQPVSQVVSLRNRLEFVLKQQTEGSTVAYECRVVGTERHLPGNTESQVYRITLESVVNAVRHSHCRKILVTLQFLPEQLTLTVQDDGDGFDVQAVAAHEGDHFGIRGMRERAAELNADFHIESSPGQGCTVKVVIPG